MMIFVKRMTHNSLIIIALKISKDNFSKMLAAFSESSNHEVCTSKRPPILPGPVTQVCPPDDEEPDDPEPGGEGVEEEGDVQLGDILDGDAAKQDQGDRKCNVEYDQQNMVDILQLGHRDVRSRRSSRRLILAIFMVVVIPIPWRTLPEIWDANFSHFIVRHVLQDFSSLF